MGFKPRKSLPKRDEFEIATITALVRHARNMRVWIDPGKNVVLIEHIGGRGHAFALDALIKTAWGTITAEIVRRMAKVGCTQVAHEPNGVVQLYFPEQNEPTSFYEVL